MTIRVLLGVLVAALPAACTGTESTPATTPTTTSNPPTTSATSTTAPPTTTTTTDRLAEIQAIFQDLEERRLNALYRGDVEAFSALFANEAYLERSLGAFDVVEFSDSPDVVHVAVLEVVSDGPTCLVARVEVDARSSLGPNGLDEATQVLEPRGGNWGYSYGGDGWVCDGQHPLEAG
jgi:hypothetical protein